MAVCLIRYFQTSLLVSGLCSLFCAIEPLQLLAERYVLTESAATFVFALFVLLCLDYLASARLLSLALIQVWGVLLISLRISFLPTVILCSFALPFLTRQVARHVRGFFSGSFHCRLSRAWHLLREVSRPLLLGLLLSQGLLFGYRHLYGDLIQPPMHGHPAYFYRDGLFLVSDFAPILKSPDYPVASQRNEIFSPSRVPLARLDISITISPATGACNKLFRKFAAMLGPGRPAAARVVRQWKQCQQ